MDWEAFSRVDRMAVCRVQFKIQLPSGPWVGPTVSKIYSWITQALCAPSCRVVKVQQNIHGFLLVGRDSGSRSSAVIIEYVFVAGREPWKRFLPQWCLLAPGWSVEWCYGLFRDKAGMKPRDKETRAALRSSSGQPWACGKAGLSPSAVPMVWDWALDDSNKRGPDWRVAMVL